jgi:hypothetical protein
VSISKLDVSADLSMSTVNIFAEGRRFGDNSGVEDVTLSIRAQKYESDDPICITLAFDQDDALEMIMKLKDALGIE